MVAAVCSGKRSRRFIEARLDGARSALPELAVQYRHFRRVAAGPGWRRPARRGSTDLLALAARRRHRATAANRPAAAANSRPDAAPGHPLRFSPELSARDQVVEAAITASTLFMTLLAAFQCLLHRHTQHDDVRGRIGDRQPQPDPGRAPCSACSQTPSCCGTDLSGDPSFSEVLRRVRQLTLDAYRKPGPAVRRGSADTFRCRAAWIGTPCSR